LTVSVHVLFVSKSVTVSVEQRFPIPGLAAHAAPQLGAARPTPSAPATFGTLLTRQEWATYCEAFA
jgi:hypothetical protein